MITFNTLLVEAGINPEEVLLLRHTPVERDLQKVLPWIAAERRDLFKVYHQTQWPRVEQAMLKACYLASFLALESGEAVFAGIYEIGAHRPLDVAGYWAAPGQRELVQLGMSGKAEDTSDCLWFELEEHAGYQDWIGKLVVSWPAMRSWWRWAGNAHLDLRAVTQESLFIPGMPDWEDIVLTWEQLSVLPASWRAALAEWRGVYFIFDEERRAGYVGSAYGADNILGRWVQYARTGHGGNKRLRESRPQDLRFSILQRLSPDLPPTETIRAEAGWKARLHTRGFGLNEN